MLLGLDISKWADVATVVIAVVAVCVALWQGRLQRRSIHLATFENAYRAAVEAENRVLETYIQPLAQAVQSDDGTFGRESQRLQKTRAVTFSSFFTAVEYMSFLFNHKIINDKTLLTFVSHSVLYWYEGIYKGLHFDLQPEAKYEEFTALYEKVKGSPGHTPRSTR